MDIKKTAKIQKNNSCSIIRPRYEEGSTLPYLGRNYPLRMMIIRKQKRIGFELC